MPTAADGPAALATLLALPLGADSETVPWVLIVGAVAIATCFLVTRLLRLRRPMPGAPMIRSRSSPERRDPHTLRGRERSDTVLQNISDGVIVVNDKGEVVRMNPAAERLLAVAQQDRIGKPLLESLKDEQLVSWVRASKDGTREVVLAATREATTQALRARHAVIADEAGNVVGMVAVLGERARQREMGRLTPERLAQVSHELRTPLVAMKHALAILTEHVAGPLSEEQQEFAMISQRNLERLTLLIDELLDTSAREARQKEECRDPP